MGLVDENRQRRPSYDVWREENAPARISVMLAKDAKGFPSGFTAVVERRRPDEIPSYELRGYRALWEARDVDHRLVASGDVVLALIGSPATVEGRWESTTSRALTVHIQLLRPTGFVAAEKTETWWEPRSGGMDLTDTKKLGIDPYR